MNDVKERLRELGVSGMTVETVSGWSKQRELHLQWRGMPVSYDLIPRVKFENCCFGSTSRRYCSGYHRSCQNR